MVGCFWPTPRKDGLAPQGQVRAERPPGGGNVCSAESPCILDRPAGSPMFTGMLPMYFQRYGRQTVFADVASGCWKDGKVSLFW
jgi:hypothetical protein